jgi:hypothetical protein
MNSLNPNHSFLEDKKDIYAEYNALDKNKRNSLAATNYWRVMNGLNEIPVPPTDENYHKYFDKGCYDRAESFRKMRDGAIEFIKTITK